MSTPTPLHRLLRATASELQDLQHIAESLQNVVVTSKVQSNESLQTLQRLDYLTQSLEALSEFWLKSEKTTPRNWSLDCDKAIADIKLKDLAITFKGEEDPTINSCSEKGVLEEF